MAAGYDVVSLTDLAVNPDKPARRWEVSRELGLAGYSLNVAVLSPGDPMAQSGLHYHADQEEFFYVIEGQCRVEFAEESVDLEADQMIRVRPETAQLIHNPFDRDCKLIAIGYPAEGHDSITAVESTAELLARRYPEE